MDHHSGVSNQAVICEEGVPLPAVDERGNARFPNIFKIYCSKTNSTSLHTEIFHLGLDQSGPLFAASLHFGWSGNNDLTLHDTPDEKSAVLATAGNDRRKSMPSTIKIPSPPASSAISEPMKTELPLTGRSHSFAIMTGIGEEAFPEKFEWRQSHRKELIAGGLLSWGWKLVRLNGDNPPGTGGTSNNAADGITSDGKEVVAVLTDFGKLSSRMAQFRFPNSGATGQLGDVWAIMSVVSALRLLQMRWFLGAA